MGSKTLDKRELHWAIQSNWIFHVKSFFFLRSTGSDLFYAIWKSFVTVRKQNRDLEGKSELSLQGYDQKNYNSGFCAKYLLFQSSLLLLLEAMLMNQGKRVWNCFQLGRTQMWGNRQSNPCSLLQNTPRGLPDDTEKLSLTFILPTFYIFASKTLLFIDPVPLPLTQTMRSILCDLGGGKDTITSPSPHSQARDRWQLSGLFLEVFPRCLTGCENEKMLEQSPREELGGHSGVATSSTSHREEGVIALRTSREPTPPSSETVEWWHDSAGWDRKWRERFL